MLIPETKANAPGSRRANLDIDGRGGPADHRLAASVWSSGARSRDRSACTRGVMIPRNARDIASRPRRRESRGFPISERRDDRSGNNGSVIDNRGIHGNRDPDGRAWLTSRDGIPLPLYLSLFLSFSLSLSLSLSLGERDLNRILIRRECRLRKIIIALGRIDAPNGTNGTDGMDGRDDAISPNKTAARKRLREIETRSTAPISGYQILADFG